MLEKNTRITYVYMSHLLSHQLLTAPEPRPAGLTRFEDVSTRSSFQNAEMMIVDFRHFFYCNIEA